MIPRQLLMRIVAQELSQMVFCVLELGFSSHHELLTNIGYRLCFLDLQDSMSPPSYQYIWLAETEYIS